MEAAVLGGLMLDASHLPTVQAVLQPADFYVERNGLVYGAICAVSASGATPDVLTVRAELERSSSLDAVGGIAYLSSLDTVLPDLAQVPRYAREVAELAHRRELMRLAAAVASGRDDALDELLGAATAARGRRLDLDGDRFMRLHETAYRLTAPEFGSVLTVDHVRREGGQMKAELRVQCALGGARTTAGILYAGDFNLSSDRTRSGLAKYLVERSRAKSLEWGDLVEEVCQRVLAADAEGEPAQDLRDVPRPGAEEVLRVQGLSLLARHPTVLFGDGGTAKSYLALCWLGHLASLDDLRVGYFDWELDGASHRERVERLYPGDQMPSITYARCSRPFSYEAERLRRIVDQHRLQFVVFDSIAPACDGRPEDAEVAARYFQHLRQLGEIGSLHIAHVSKSQDGSQMRPFGSTFWHNLARSTWNVQADNSGGGENSSSLKVALHHRKSNMGALQRSVAYELWFGHDRTRVSLASFEDEPALAEGLSLRHRIEIALRSCGGSLSRAELLDELGAKSDTLDKTLRRHQSRFQLLPGGRVALAGGRS